MNLDERIRKQILFEFTAEFSSTPGIPVAEDRADALQGAVDKAHEEIKQLIRDVLEYVKPRPVYKLNGKKYIFSENTANYMNAKIKDLGL